ncbi:MAG: hypothetical protein MUF21_01880 [Gemmatimonadaceae bacterium]|nr:hypothetical protein [Gemmatimonadaceae bacterium]
MIRQGRSRAATAWPLHVVALVVFVLVLIGVLGSRRSDARSMTRAQLAAAARFADSVEARVAVRGSPLGGDDVLAWSYLARQRDALGSPFRLIDLARLDPRLRPHTRRQVAWALLARTAEAEALPPGAGDALAVAASADSVHGAGAALARAIARAVGDDRSPETLDALRIAALVAAADGVLHQRATPLVGATAVLVRDRLRARLDAQRVIAAAVRGDGDALQVVADWRAARLLQSEQPSLADAPADARRVAARVPVLVERLTAAARTGAVTPVRASAPARVSAALRALPSVTRHPPRPQVRLPLMDAVSLVRAIRGDGWRHGASAFAAATHEEAFVAALADARRDPVIQPAADVASILVAQGLRVVAQEVAWHPGLPTPEPATVVARLGLGSLRFGDEVPEEWRPWYAREVATAVASLRAVFPLTSVRGLQLRVGGRVDEEALALHDPATRTLLLPVATGFGAVGHELLHDIDWQVARDELGRRGSYATDLAMRDAPRRRAPLAAPLARLASLAVPTASAPDSRRAREARRPAELLARGGDWYMAAALARMGRSDGALTSVQDAWTPGYASAARPDAFGARDAALAALLDAMPSLAQRAPAYMGDGAVADIGALARLAASVPLRTGPASTFPLTASASGVDGAALRVRPVACTPLQRARLAPVRAAAIEVVDAVLAPRVRTALARWAMAPAPDAEPEAHRWLRLALTGAPVTRELVRRAEAETVIEARSLLPCLGDAL